MTCLCRSQKLLHNEWCVSQSIVIIVGPRVMAPLSGWFPSIASECRSRIFHPVTVCPGGTDSLCTLHVALNVKKKKKKNKPTSIWHCSELVVLSSVAVKLESSTEITAASSQGYTQTPKIGHQCRLWRYNWGCFRPVPSAQCRQQCGIPFV